MNLFCGEEMASRKKPRFINKRSSKANEEAQSSKATEEAQLKEGDGMNKPKPKKQKLYDVLGPQWSKEELERFYEAYRKYGKDWEKVANVVRNRTVEMVDALFNMNKAYLSLPEGAASVVGLIAMMTDHYNILVSANLNQHEESDTDKEVPKKSLKRPHKKHQLGSSRDGDTRLSDLQHRTVSPSYGHFDLLNRPRSEGNGPRVVGKRTPRFPVSYSRTQNKGSKKFVHQKQDDLSEADDDDDDVAQEAALALAEASQRGTSPPYSRTPSRKTNQERLSPFPRNGRAVLPGSGVYDPKNTASRINKRRMEGSEESREAENVYDVGALRHDAFLHVGSTDVKRIRRTPKKTPEKRPSDQGIESSPYDDLKEECSSTHDGFSIIPEKDEHDKRVADKRSKRVPSKVSMKRSRLQFTKDETSAIDALQALADITLNGLFPSSGMESESSVQVREEKGNTVTVDKPDTHEVMSIAVPKVRAKSSHKEKRTSATQGGDDDTTTSKLLNLQAHKLEPIPTFKEKSYKSPNLSFKGKRKSFTSKQVEDPCSFTDEEPSTKGQEGKLLAHKVKADQQLMQLNKHGKLPKTLEGVSSNIDQGNPEIDALGVTNSHPMKTESKRRRRRKVDPQATTFKDVHPIQSIRGSASSDNVGGNGLINKESSVAPYRASDLEDKVAHCLSSPKLRRWCMFEWFYSAIDFPWFAQSEFVDYLNHVHLGRVRRLTRVEWGVIRSSLGKPRRLSEQFLREEREKLEEYRESVREHYAEVRIGALEGLATDLARPLSVGQRVIACHPRTREIHDGSILTVDRNRCRVQFDRNELGVEFVADIDCMPLNPLENLSEALRRKSTVFDSLKDLYNPKVDVEVGDFTTGGLVRSFGSEAQGFCSEMLPHLTGKNNSISNLVKHAKVDTIDATMQAKAAVSEAAIAAQEAMYNQPCTLAQIQAREADIRALADLMRPLEKKEALLMELKNMNEELGKNPDGEESFKHSEHLQKQYATIMLQLRDVNVQVAKALLNLRQRNTYQNGTNPWLLRADVALHGLSNAPNFVSQESGSHMWEIVQSSQRKAKSIVYAAIQGLSSLKEGEDTFNKLRDALDAVNTHHPATEVSLSAVGALGATEENAQDGPPLPDAQSSGAPSSMTANGVNVSQNSTSDTLEAKLPLELISACVATLQMVQVCAERQIPPAEVTQILDAAVAHLQPCCSQNLMIYQEIQQCMGMVKNQILALIPTQ